MNGDYDAKLIDVEKGEDGSTIFVLECRYLLNLNLALKTNQ